MLVLGFLPHSSTFFNYTDWARVLLQAEEEEEEEVEEEVKGGLHDVVPARHT